MRILFLADGRSPIALNWIDYFLRQGDDVHLVSSFPCSPPAGLTSFWVIPVAFSSAKAASPATEAWEIGSGWLWGGRLVKLRTVVRQWLGPLTLPRAARRLAPLITALQPDLIHAMRIPYEGMLAALVLAHLNTPPPLLVSVWGNDFTLHARANPWMSVLTRRTLNAAAALHTDCQRDLRLAHEWGFARQKPSVVLPGAGGLQLDVFKPPMLNRSANLVVNPRGIRAYVRNDTFFQAAAILHQAHPEIRFVCPNMAGERQALRWIEQLGLRDCVDLLPKLSRGEMAQIFQRANLVTSITTHDGTPNSLLEALACACFPIAGNIEALREWITPGVNGFLVDPGDPKALAAAILQALDDPDLRLRAAVINERLVRERAEYGAVMQQASVFYRNLTTPN